LLADISILDSSLDQLLANYDIYLLSKYTITNNGVHLNLHTELLALPDKSYIAIPLLFANLQRQHHLHSNDDHYIHRTTHQPHLAIPLPLLLSLINLQRPHHHHRHIFPVLVLISITHLTHSNPTIPNLHPHLLSHLLPPRALLPNPLHPLLNPLHHLLALVHRESAVSLALQAPRSLPEVWADGV
jgi:hypothetical protein